MAEAPKLKDYFTREVVDSFADRVGSVLPSFDRVAFVDAVMAPAGEAIFLDLEFTGRTRRIATALHDTWGLDGAEALSALVKLLPDELEQTDGVLNDGFWLWPLGDYIAMFGADELESGLDACYALTKCFTSEFAIRPILAAYPAALDRLAVWVHDPNEHVRRLVSEGTRPRLPWASRLDLPAEAVIALLHELRNDPSAYVRKSVANHLNDLLKADPDRIFDLVEEWNVDATEPTQWIIRHALRNQLKDGHPRALALYGYKAPKLTVDDLAVDPAAVAIGESIEATFLLVSELKRDQRLMVDIVMGYVKANGSVSPKVFKFREFDLLAGATEVCKKRFDMVERSTRKLHPGEHEITIRVNGTDLATTKFTLDP